MLPIRICPTWIPVVATEGTATTALELVVVIETVTAF